MFRRLWPVWSIALLCLGACTATVDEPQPVPTAPPTTGAPTTIPLAPPAGMELVTGASADGFAEVEAALAAAVTKWEATRPEMYGYRVTIDDASAERRVSWVRVFERGWPEIVSWDVEQLHAWVAGAVDGSPDRIEVAFDPELGIPMWFSVEGEQSESILIDEIHEIVLAPSPFDGSWRFVEGEIDGREFTNPSTGLIWVELENGHISFPIDCNDAHGAVDIHNGYFGVGLIGMTAVWRVLGGGRVVLRCVGGRDDD